MANIRFYGGDSPCDDYSDDQKVWAIFGCGLVECAYCQEELIEVKATKYPHPHAHGLHFCHDICAKFWDEEQEGYEEYELTNKVVEL